MENERDIRSSRRESCKRAITISIESPSLKNKNESSHGNELIIQYVVQQKVVVLLATILKITVKGRQCQLAYLNSDQTRDWFDDRVKNGYSMPVGSHWRNYFLIVVNTILEYTNHRTDTLKHLADL